MTEVIHISDKQTLLCFLVSGDLFAVGAFNTLRLCDGTGVSAINSRMEFTHMCTATPHLLACRSTSGIERAQHKSIRTRFYMCRCTYVYMYVHCVIVCGHVSVVLHSN